MLIYPKSTMHVLCMLMHLSLDTWLCYMPNSPS